MTDEGERDDRHGETIRQGVSNVLGTEAHTTKGAPLTCPDCGHINDRFTGAATPQPGAMIVCGECGGVAVFEGEGRSRKATDEEVAENPYAERLSRGFKLHRKLSDDLVFSDDVDEATREIEKRPGAHHIGQRVKAGAPPRPIRGNAVKRRCRRCSEQVWVSGAIMKRAPTVPVMCAQCAGHVLAGAPLSRSEQ